MQATAHLWIPLQREISRRFHDRRINAAQVLIACHGHSRLIPTILKGQIEGETDDH